MSSPAPARKVPQADESATPDEGEKVIGGNASKDQRYVVDRACLELDMKRGVFVVQAAVEKAVAVLQERDPSALVGRDLA